MLAGYQSYWNGSIVWEAPYSSQPKPKSHGWQLIQGLSPMQWVAHILAFVPRYARDDFLSKHWEIDNLPDADVCEFDDVRNESLEEVYSHGHFLRSQYPVFEVFSYVSPVVLVSVAKANNLSTWRTCRSWSRCKPQPNTGFGQHWLLEMVEIGQVPHSRCSEVLLQMSWLWWKAQE